MKNLQTTYMGLQLKNPIIASSSGLTSNIESIKKLANEGVGAIVLKSLFEEQINYESGRLEAFGVEHPDAINYIRAYSTSNSLESYLNLIKLAKKETDIPIIASVSCISDNEWIEFAKNIEEAGADALELNLFFLPVNKDKLSSEYEATYFEVINDLKKKIKIPIAVKIGFYFTNPLRMVKELYNHKANAAVLFNRFYESDIDIENMMLKSAEVFSRPSDLRLSLRWISLISAQMPEMELSASTGVHDGAAVVKLLLAGAQTVQLCSTLYKNGVEQIAKILEFVSDWMKRHGYKSIDEFRGEMNYKNIPEPDIYERSQFMKYYSSRENL